MSQLAATDPIRYVLAIAMEICFRHGKHFRGDDVWTVVAVEKTTGEKEEIDVVASSAAEARAEFRRMYADEARPYRYKLSTGQAVAGLGRAERWQSIAVDLAPEYVERLTEFAARRALKVQRRSLPQLTLF